MKIATKHRNGQIEIIKRIQAGNKELSYTIGFISESDRPYLLELLEPIVVDILNQKARAKRLLDSIKPL